MISALSWVKKGAAAQTPEKYVLTDEEFQRIQQATAKELEDATEEVAMALENPSDEAKNDEDLKEYEMDKYDEQDEGQEFGLFSNVQGLKYHGSNQEDPYITAKDEEDDEEELEEMLIAPTDNLIIAAKTEDDLSHIEVYVYEAEEENLYVHHDFMIPAFPLCVEWLDFRIGAKSDQPGTGNYVAVGSFDPTIEVWDLDVVGAVFPDVILGRVEEEKKKGKKKKKSIQVNPERHVDAVLALSWNKHQRNLLVSGSADTTVKLWDLQHPVAAIHSYNHHKDKVQCVEWNPQEPTVLLTAGYDKRAIAFDSRAPTKINEWKLDSDVECLKWMPTSGHEFLVSTESGTVQSFDGRQGNSKSLWTLHAHDAPVSALDINPKVSDCIVTGASDKTVKIWSIKDAKPRMVVSREMDVGRIFAAQFCPDSPHLVAVSGTKGSVAIWNVGANAGVKKTFGNALATEASKEVLMPESDEDSSDHEEEMEVDEEGWEDE